MQEFPKGGIIGKTVHLWRRVVMLRIPLYAANASYFIVMALFPGLVLLLGLLQYTTLEVERLGEMLSGVLPEAFLEGAEALILTTYDSLSGTVLGLSAATSLWSAGRGMYGVLTGLNAIYGVEENRSYLRTRLTSMIYMLAFLLILLLTLMLHVGVLHGTVDQGHVRTGHDLQDRLFHGGIMFFKSFHRYSALFHAQQILHGLALVQVGLFGAGGQLDE